MKRIATTSRSRCRPHAPSGFTLVELMIVVAIIGLLAAVAIPAFSRYLRKSRTPEAMQIVDKLTRGAVTYYETDHNDASGGLLPKQFPGAATMPAGSYCWPPCGCQTGGKCAPTCTDWEAPLWRAVNFSMPDPHTYVPFAYAVVATQFEARAVGDQDCDGTHATFRRLINIGANGEPTKTTATVVVNEDE